jgi:hypothetical protein
MEQIERPLGMQSRDVVPEAQNSFESGRTRRDPMNRYSVFDINGAFPRRIGIAEYRNDVNVKARLS